MWPQDTTSELASQRAGSAQRMTYTHQRRNYQSPPPPGPTTVGPTDVPSECADSWIGDNYCDDENNNAACQFDGGDCCQESPAAGWDNYCNACECLEQQTTTTEAPEENDETPSEADSTDEGKESVSEEGSEESSNQEKTEDTADTNKEKSEDA